MSKARSGDVAGLPLSDMRICRLHELVVRDETGHSRAFRFGERVAMTPALLDALGPYADRFEHPVLDANAPFDPFITASADTGVTLPPGTVTALVDPAHEE